MRVGKRVYGGRSFPAFLSLLVSTHGVSRFFFQVVFVDSSKDELAVLAASGQVVEHDVPGWQERLRLHRLELTVSWASARAVGYPPEIGCSCSHAFLRTLRGEFR